MPPVVLNLVPQTLAGLVVGSVVIVPAKPLKDVGATPPVRLFTEDQEFQGSLYTSLKDCSNAKFLAYFPD